ncbi:hypothetical protein [Arcticibacter tournemirensis]|uniref:NnrS family protein n=1 Tax=Arcticibacter tournemirensis TaxID=699437 RepID=A0A4Q0MB02_9SPHI|nr:hypothetical protein [Arcticibacter tournemirensis]RXF70460.1 hypothetical protein EKH83_07380 [Arcticibacter tournemirensis]
MEWIQASSYPRWAVANFLILTILGILLRWMHLASVPGVNYMFLLHAHSHFAFAGWVFLAIVILIAGTLSSDKTAIRAFKRIFILTLIASFGMLISFFLQGYKAVSISFSSLFIFISYYVAYVILKSNSLKETFNPISRALTKASLVFLCLSSLGPFALGPLAAAGLKANPLYQNSIYFYLHFQMNGWMLLAVLGLLANTYLKNTSFKKGERLWLHLFIGSTIPLFFIFTLWSNPPLWIGITGFAGAAVNFVSWVKLLSVVKHRGVTTPLFVRLALLAVTLKIFFQILVCIPAVGLWVFSSRYIIIGYIHLLTLGCIMPLILDQFGVSGFFKPSPYLNYINNGFIGLVIIYLCFLFVQPVLSILHIAIPFYEYSLLITSLLFALPAIGYFRFLHK